MRGHKDCHEKLFKGYCGLVFMGNEDNQVQRVSVRRMIGPPLLTECEGIFEKRKLGSGNGGTVIYTVVKPFGFGKIKYSIKIKSAFNSANSDANLKKLGRRLDYFV